MIRDGELLDTLRQTVRRFVRERLLPAEARVEQEDAIPQNMSPRCASWGCSAWRSRRSMAGSA
jgi:acyl-CoA dehydrogenase